VGFSSDACVLGFNPSGSGGGGGWHKGGPYLRNIYLASPVFITLNAMTSTLGHSSSSTPFAGSVCTDIASGLLAASAGGCRGGGSAAGGAAGGSTARERQASFAAGVAKLKYPAKQCGMSDTGAWEECGKCAGRNGD
jgi:hypothetical protein